MGMFYSPLKLAGLQPYGNVNSFLFAPSARSLAAAILSTGFTVWHVVASSMRQNKAKA